MHLDPADALRSKDCECQQGVPCTCGGRTGKFPWKYGDHKLVMFSCDNHRDLTFGLLVSCEECNAFSVGTLRRSEILINKSPSLLAERALQKFVSKYPRNCNETMIKLIHEL